MRFAYADPPYPGQSSKYYRNHPDFAGEVDHAELIERLCREYPDGWALSTSMVALQEVLALCPPDVLIAAWHVTNAAPPGARPWDWHYSWEPVIVRVGRPAPGVKNVLSYPAPTGALAATLGLKNFPGAKPPRFTQWICGLLGARPDDVIDDLFPGGGAVSAELARRDRMLPW